MNMVRKNSLKIHPRHKKVSTARNEISTAICNTINTHELTYGELFSIISNELQSWSGYLIKDERKGGD